MDKLRMDSHKLLYHPDEVARWLRGEPIYPLEMEVGLSGACNHRCIFCAVEYIGYRPNFLDTELILATLRELSQKGLKSVIYSGEGEPLLHRDAPNILNRTKTFGIDVALATNGVLLTKEMAKEFLPSMSWIRFSISAAHESTYQNIQRGKPGDLHRLYRNLSDAVEVKKKQKLQVTLGAQLLLLPENKAEVLPLAVQLRDIGMDYLSIKPFSQHPMSTVQRQVDYSESEEIERQTKEIETEDFKIYFRRQSIENLSQKKSYDRCYALPFMTHIDAKGDVFPCIAFVGMPNLCYGNLYANTFSAIWESDHTRSIMETFQGDFLQNHCRKACRLDEMNKYLYQLKHPNPHHNFI